MTKASEGVIQSLFDSWTDAMTSGLTVNENRAEAGDFSTYSCEARGGDRAVPWEPGESGSKNFMVKPLETRTNVDRSRSSALRGLCSSRRDLPKVPPPLTQRRLCQLWTLKWRQARPLLSRRRQCVRPLTSDGVCANTKISESVVGLSWQKQRTARARHAQRKQRMCGIRQRSAEKCVLSTRSLLQCARTVCPFFRVDCQSKRGFLSKGSRVTAKTACGPQNVPTLADGSSTASPTASQG